MSGTRGRGPRRKAQLLDAAVRLFQHHGFHNVSMVDIASEVGVTGPALYRHFASKHALLAAALDEQVTAAEELTEVALTLDGPPADRLDAYFVALTAQVLDLREALIWVRELAHLTPNERGGFRDRIDALRTGTALALQDWRPELADDDAELLAWSLLSLYAGTRDYRDEVSRAVLTSSLPRIAWAIAGCDIASAPRGASPIGSRHTPPEASRRERVLECATELFYRRGYHRVSVEDIAETSGTAIGTVYQLFASKSSLLSSVLTRGTEGTAYVTAHRLAQTPHMDVSELDTVATTYLELCLGPHGRLLRILVDEAFHLDEDTHRALRRSQREHVEEWIRALRAARPSLDAHEALVRAHSTLGVLSETTQIGVLRSRPNVHGELKLLAREILSA